MYEWDEEKAKTNLKKHGVAFETAASFEWEFADIRIDDDPAHGEERLVATGMIGARLHVMVYAERGERLRIISLRAATKQEKKRYEEGL